MLAFLRLPLPTLSAFSSRLTPKLGFDGLALSRSITTRTETLRRVCARISASMSASLRTFQLAMWISSFFGTLLMVRIRCRMMLRRESSLPSGLLNRTPGVGV